MINEPTGGHGMTALPPGAMGTMIITQELLDEASRALDRPLWDYEVRMLDTMLLAQGRANLKLAKMGKSHKTHSADEITSIFIKVVKDKEMEAQWARVIAKLEAGQ
jgi:hypothetical protein